MTHTFTKDTPASSGLGHLTTQKFGRIEAVRLVVGGTEIDLRQPDGTSLTASLTTASVDTGASKAMVGRNIWISGHLDGNTITARAFAVYAQEL